MPLVKMGPMLRTAIAGKRAVAAVNIIDFNSARAVIDCAQDLGVPVIAQVSVKTVRHWGARPVANWVRTLAEDADIDVALHLDHCTDEHVIRTCIDAGWTAVMFDGSSLPFAENLERSVAIYHTTQAAGVSLECEIGAIGGVEDDKVVSEGSERLADYDECIAFAAAMPEMGVFAPAIGTAHGFYNGEPRIDYDLLQRVAEGTGLPIALHGGTGLSDEQFTTCIARGCAKVNLSTMHKRDFIEGFGAPFRQAPPPTEPLPYIASQYDAMKSSLVPFLSLFSLGRRVAV